MRIIPLLTASTCSLVSLGQPEVMLLNGSMTVVAGTSIVLTDTLAWQFASGSSLVNDGLIDLGQHAVLEELDGEPVTGSGTERSLLDLSLVDTAVEPGGTGLEIEPTATDGLLSITRGHLPRVAGDGVEGVARWYLIEGPLLTTMEFPVRMWIDATELNGLDLGQLALHASGSPDGPWEELATTMGPLNELQAVLPGAGLYLTAFDPDLITGSDAMSAATGYRIWPTVVQEMVHVESLDHLSGLEELEVLDLTGRPVLQALPATGSSVATLNLQGLAPGGYLIRVNKGVGYRVVKP